MPAEEPQTLSLPLLRGGRGAALLVALCLAAWSALGLAGFVWDDVALVVGNRYTHDITNLPGFFLQDLWETSEIAERSGYYRPLMLASLAVDRALWGLSPAGAHLHSVAWHVGASLALLALLRGLLTPERAWLGAAIFALHPVQSEGVAWVVARNDLMAATFVFLATLALLPERPGRWRLAGGAAAMLAALLSKESAVLAFALLGMLDLARWSRPRGAARYAALAAPVAAVIALRAAAGIEATDFPMDAGRRLLLERGPEVLALYSRRVLWPLPLSVGETLEYLEVPGPTAALWLAGLAALAGATLLRGRRLAAAGWLFAGAAFAPSLLAIAIRGQLGERYLYLAMAGVGLAVASAVPATRRWALACGAVLLGWMAALNQRLPDWKDGLSLFAAAVESTPNGFTFAELGHELNRAERPEEALAWFTRALADDPPYTDICPQVVRLPLRLGDPATAWERARWGREERGCEETPLFLGLYASAAAQCGEWDAAREAIGRIPDPTDNRSVVVAAALAKRDGDEVTFTSLSQRAGVTPEALEQAVDGLLAAAGGSGCSG
jgi:tetratricopeptide (TPR) repeat protein